MYVTNTIEVHNAIYEQTKERATANDSQPQDLHFRFDPSGWNDVNDTKSLTIADGVTTINGWIYIFTVVGGVGLYAASLVPYAGRIN